MTKVAGVDVGDFGSCTGSAAALGGRINSPLGVVEGVEGFDSQL